jgi:transposase
MATRAEWAGRVARWEASGLSAAAFAARERIDAKRLVWWRWKLRSTPPASSAAAIDFLPVRVLDAQPARPSPAGPIEIALPNGRVVRVPAGFDAADLERVLAIASGPSAC